MELNKMYQILSDCAYVRTGGSQEELRCARYIQDCCAQMGLEATLEEFEVEMSTIRKAELWVDGQSIPCTGYSGSGCADLEAEVCYLTVPTDPYGLSQCKGKIVLSDSMMGYWHYQDLIKAGAVGFITYNGEINYPNNDLEQRELRSYVHKGSVIPGVNLHVKTATALVNKGITRARIVLDQEEYKGKSHNVVLDLPGQIDETIVFTAHYDTTPLSVGVWDNMSGAVGLLALAEHFKDHPHRYGLRFVWTGSEERGLLGAKAYVADHEAELEKFPLNINLDMIGCIMGKRLAACTCEEKMVHYIQYLNSELGVAMDVRQRVSSSDSTPFADKGVPAISFARIAPDRAASIHHRYDTLDLMKMEHLQEDVDYLITFTDRMANAKRCPVGREIPEKMKKALDEYLCRKRPEV